MYSTWTIPQLKKELRSRGASLKGKKADLDNRLECYDRNYNFSAALADENEDGLMLLPAVDMYHDINSSMLLPPLTKEHIRFYFMDCAFGLECACLFYVKKYCFDSPQRPGLFIWTLDLAFIRPLLVWNADLRFLWSDNGWAFAAVDIVPRLTVSLPPWK